MTPDRTTELVNRILTAAILLGTLLALMVS